MTQALGIHDMTFDQYSAAAGISKSKLDDISPPSTPAYFKCRWIDGAIKEENTNATAFGTTLHRCLLQPDTVKDAFHVAPKTLVVGISRLKAIEKSARVVWDGSTHYADKWMAEHPDEALAEIEWNGALTEAKQWMKAHEDRPVLFGDDAEAIIKIRDSVYAHKSAARLLRASQKEKNVFAEDSHRTLRKARLDLVPETGNLLPDLKSCRSAAPEDFSKAVFDYRLYVQAAYYLDIAKLVGIDKQSFCFICVEKTPPYLVAVYELESDALELGRREYRRDLAIYRHCLERDYWPGYGDGIDNINIPEWARKRIEAMQ